jgi:hypothetical protein
MSTRSIIAIPDGQSWKGRYCHWDGYPANMGMELTAIIRRDGYETAIKVLTEDNRSWSSIKSDQSATDAPNDIPGYGTAHNDLDDGEDPWLFPNDEDWTEWAYVMNPFGIAVYRRRNGLEDQFVGLFDWEDNLDWTEIQDMIYDRLEV